MNFLPPPLKRKKWAPPTMADVRAGEKRADFTVVSTFAGTGGSSTGYRLAGGKVLAVNEFVKAARDSYKANYPDTPIIPGDIRTLTPQDILNVIDLEAGELDLLDGSPPCASFSMSGKREKHWGKEKKYSDTKQRTDDLFFEFARILEGLQPRAFIAENVSGLNMGKAKSLLGDGEKDLFGESKSTIIGTLEKCGYQVYAKVISAKHFGVPQNRPRLIMIGARNDLEIYPTFPKPITQYDPITYRMAIETLSLTGADLRPAMISDKYAIYKLLKEMKAGQCGSEVHEKGSYFSLSRLAWDEPVGTVCQSHGSPGIACAHIHPEEMRKLTIKELKRVSSFPDDFIVTGTFQEKWERIGRAVPPLMMKCVARHVFETILNGEEVIKVEFSRERKMTSKNSKKEAECPFCHIDSFLFFVNKEAIFIGHCNHFNEKKSNICEAIFQRAKSGGNNG